MVPDSTGRRWRGVVAGFDETDRGRSAVRHAAAVAAWQECPLYVVRVLEHPPVMSYGWTPMLTPATRQRSCAEQPLLAEVKACRDVYSGVNVHATLHEGHPGALLAEYAEQVGAELIAVGGSARRRWSRVVLGSTACKLVRVTGRPVVVVRDTTPVQQAAMMTGQSPVVVDVDDVTGSGPILDFAFDAAARNDADLRLVAPANVLATASFDVHLARRRSRSPQVTVETETADAPVPALLEHSELARLLVVGHRAREATGRLLPRTAGREILHDAECSVSVVASGKREYAAPNWAGRQSRVPW